MIIRYNLQAVSSKYYIVPILGNSQITESNSAVLENEYGKIVYVLYLLFNNKHEKRKMAQTRNTL